MNYLDALLGFTSGDNGSGAGSGNASSMQPSIAPNLQDLFRVGIQNQYTNMNGGYNSPVNMSNSTGLTGLQLTPKNQTLLIAGGFLLLILLLKG